MTTLDILFPIWNHKGRSSRTMGTAEKSTTNNDNYAGFGIRFLAYWVDYLIIFIITAVPDSLMGMDPFVIFRVKSLEELNNLQSSPAYFLSILISLIIAVLYYIIFWVKYDGATPGKKLLGIKITTADRKPIGIGTSIARLFGLFVSFLSFLFFGLGFLWILWDKKKQGWHDKIAGTVVVKTDKKPQLVLAILLTLFTILAAIAYYITAFIFGMYLGLKEVKTNPQVKDRIVKEQLAENQLNDKDKILSFAPSSCGLSIAIPKTTDTQKGKARKWLFEEIALSPNDFYVLDKDVFQIKSLQGVFVGYKEATSRLGGQSFSVAYPGLNMYCADNTKNLTLDEYVALTLTNKTYTVTKEKNVIWGEVLLTSIWLEGKDETGQATKEPAYLGVSKDGKKLIYIRLWSAQKDDEIKQQIDDDVDMIIRNLQYRGSATNTVKGATTGEIYNKNVKGTNPKAETVKSF